MATKRESARKEYERLLKEGVTGTQESVESYKGLTITKYRLGRVVEFKVKGVVIPDEIVDSVPTVEQVEQALSTHTSRGFTQKSALAYAKSGIDFYLERGWITAKV